MAAEDGLKTQMLRKQYALKGQKLLAQGIALGIKAISKAPCNNPGRCPGLGASALSGRIGCDL